MPNLGTLFATLGETNFVLLSKTGDWHMTPMLQVKLLGVFSELQPIKSWARADVTNADADNKKLNPKGSCFTGNPSEGFQYCSVLVWIRTVPIG